MYAIVKTGGKQYRVQEGESLLIERLAAEDGATVALQPLLFVDGADVVDGADLADVSVQARVLGHERGPKLRIVKFKPKRGYKRRTGHRQELTRIQITSLGRGSGGGHRPVRAAASSSATPEAGGGHRPVRAAAPSSATPEAGAAHRPVRAAASSPATQEASDGA